MNRKFKIDALIDTDAEKRRRQAEATAEIIRMFEKLMSKTVDEKTKL